MRSGATPRPRSSRWPAASTPSAARQARPGPRTRPDRCAGGCANATPGRWCEPSGSCSSATASRCCATESRSTSSGAVRRVLLPHAVNEPTRRIGHGKHTTVNGFVGLADGTALAGQTVDVYSSPDDNAPRFKLMRTVTTNASGAVDGQGAPGPSRLIEAVYPGNTTTEPANLLDGQAHRAGANRDVDLAAGRAVVQEDHDQRSAGRGLGASRRRRATAAGALPRRTLPPGAVPHELARRVQLPVVYGSGRGVVFVSLRRGDDRDRIRTTHGRPPSAGGSASRSGAHAALAPPPSPSARLREAAGRPPRPATRAGRVDPSRPTLCRMCDGV